MYFDLVALNMPRKIEVKILLKKRKRPPSFIVVFVANIKIQN